MRVCAAVGILNIIGKAKHAFLIRVAPLQRQLHLVEQVVAVAGRGLGARDANGLGVQRTAIFRQVLHEFGNPVGKGKSMVLARAFVGDVNAHALVQERLFAHARGQLVKVEFYIGKNSIVGPKPNERSPALRRAQLAQRARGLSPTKNLLVAFAVAIHA